MRLTGDLYFDFEDVECWRLFLLLTRAEETENVTVDLEWHGLDPAWDGGAEPLEGGRRALAMHAAVHDPARQRTVRAALFTLRHREGDRLDDDLALMAAAQVAGLDPEVMVEAIDTTGAAELRRSLDSARSAGVDSVPTLVRDGPPLTVSTTPAVEHGPAAARLEIIDHMLADDGLWKLTKP
jgi:hypothetical protein